MPAHKRLSAGAVVVRESSDGPQFLLLRAYNHWDFPKGLVEPGEDPKSAAIREVREETTIDDLSFRWGERHIETGPYSRGKTARYYIAQTDARSVRLPANPESGKPEHNEYRWVDYSRARQLVSIRVQPVLDWAVQQIAGSGAGPLGETLIEEGRKSS